MKKNREKKLPLYFPPPITSYLPYSVISAIVCANGNNLDWIYNNFIQLYHNGFGKVDYYPNSDFAYQDKLYLSATELCQHNYRMRHETIIEDMKYWIDNGNYIVFYLAESKIPNTRFFNHSDVIHSQFIFGYEEKDHIFYLMNFGISEKLEIIKLKFEDLLVALEYTINLNGKRKNLQSTTMRDQGKDFRLILLKYNDSQNRSYDSGINLQYIKQQLVDLVECNNSSVHHSYFTSWQHGIWGLDTYEEIKKEYKKNTNGKEVDIRFVFMLYEHKILMLKRMEYLKERYSIESCSEKMSLVVKKVEMLKNTVLKYNITKKESLLCKFEHDLDKIRELEKEIYTEYISNIKT